MEIPGPGGDDKCQRFLKKVYSSLENPRRLRVGEVSTERLLWR